MRYKVTTTGHIETGQYVSAELIAARLYSAHPDIEPGSVTVEVVADPRPAPVANAADGRANTVDLSGLSDSQAEMVRAFVKNVTEG